MKALALAAVLAALPCCTSWVRVRFHEGSESSQALACFPSEDEANTIECWDYFIAHLRMRRGQRI